MIINLKVGNGKYLKNVISQELGGMSIDLKYSIQVDSMDILEIILESESIPSIRAVINNILKLSDMSLRTKKILSNPLINN